MYWKSYIISVGIVALVITKFLQRHYKQLELKKYSPSYKYKLIFTSVRNKDCKQHIYNSNICGLNCSYSYLKIIIDYIGTSKHSLSLCTSFTTFKEVQQAIIEAHKRGVHVQYITDKAFINAKAARRALFREAGIEIKTPSNMNEILHHKFCIIDKHHPTLAKLFFGSLNLTAQGLCSNFDLIIFCNNTETVQRFNQEFEYLWEKFNKLD